MSRAIIIVPCYNEELSIATTVKQLESSGYDYVIVNDGSNDKSLNILLKSNANVILHEINKGQGAALRTGFHFAVLNDYDYVIHFDADGQHEISNVPELLEKLIEDKYDIVFGSRFLDNAKRSVPLLKRVILSLARYFEYFRTGILLSDAHCGLRGLKVESCKHMDLKANGMAHASEILSETKRLKLKYTELAVNVNYNILKKPESNLKRIFMVLKELVFLAKKP